LCPLLVAAGLLENPAGVLARRLPDNRVEDRLSGRRVEGADQFVNRSFPRYETIDPMQIGKTHPKTLLRLGVIDPEWDYDLAGFAGHGDLTANIFAFVATFGEDQKHRPAGVYGLGDLIVEWFARTDVARRYPAAHATSLKLADNILGVGSVFSNMADK
jgi:hypothetical protein